MHIAHFTNTYKPNVNGVARSVSTFRTGLTSLGHNALKKADNFEMTIQAKKMVAVYEQAIDDKKANRYVQIDRDRVEAAMHERQENA
jgi:hypothetical protein